MGDITEWLGQAFSGDRAAADRVFSRIYQDLHAIAARQLIQGTPMRTTSLVHDCWLRLVRAEHVEMSSRAHFFALAARAMRQIAIDRLRRQQAEKRGGGLDITALDGMLDVAGPSIDDSRLLDLDRALGDLEAIDPEAVRLVELRFFAGLPLEQIAPLLEVSERTLKRRWRTARAFLHRQLEVAAHEP
ncbi:MAG TPA: ECF-type sigma factor [Patescibacteria group bacterium]|nr:ECF-type sigma factor [Patescibacteria group bacterium]